MPRKKRYYATNAETPLSIRLQNGHLMSIHNGELKQALGCDPNQHWPDDGAAGSVNGVTIMVCKKGETIAQVRGLRQLVVKAESRIARRAFAHCEDCDRWVCAGHFGQHRAACKGGGK